MSESTVKSPYVTHASAAIGDGWYAHSATDSKGRAAPRESWELLFTPFGGECGRDCRGKDCAKCQILERYHGHLNKVACLSAKFTETFSSSAEEGEIFRHWGWLAGLWHDLGKFSREFQSYLCSGTGGVHEGETTQRVDHSTAGAQHAVQVLGVLGHLIGYTIAGHHSGLLDGEAEGACQRNRLRNLNLPQLFVPDSVRNYSEIQAPNVLLRAMKAKEFDAFRTAFFCRMLFSCLVDADFLATESFMNPGQASVRNQVPTNALESMLKLLEQRISAFGEPESGDLVNRLRAQVVADCKRSSRFNPGFFTLTVPTGGGKNLVIVALRSPACHSAWTATGYLCGSVHLDHRAECRCISADF